MLITWRGMRECKDGECMYYPALEELIEKCRKPLQIIIMSNGYVSVLFLGGDGLIQQAPTPEEAVANLWLNLPQNQGKTPGEMNAMQKESLDCCCDRGGDPHRSVCPMYNTCCDRTAAGGHQPHCDNFPKE